MSAELAHIPVALTRCLDLLAPAIESSSKPYLIDATFLYMILMIRLTKP